MNSVLTETLIKKIEQSEMDYMYDRVTAIQERPGNPEGIAVQKFGNALCLYSRTMPWAAFNTVKGFSSSDVDRINQIMDYYIGRGRKVQFEIVPSLVDQNVLKHLSERGLYQSGFHTSVYTELTASNVNVQVPSEYIEIEELQENQMMTYASIHCRGTGLSDDGIPYVAANNQVLYNRPGWKFFIAYYQKNPAAVAVMYTKDTTASLTFAATLPEYRNLGLHQLLIKKRIEEARKSNCKLVVSQCAFLSQSHRNMECAGMKIGYVRTTWTS
ncbi:GNAT family N-acetyltransferase [Paenibacillus sp. N1-5-1-14]|uniref:GNAT family N-acetyltransferase n=1 Tax=Paenibacillus radicibacter TaxID=2972488 RepID=UPI0021594EEB|nr:GNAT family N-acetyltransferase [Paenibacillus radicibacter]MCR8644488.1 GNAT family N-acetyltransferase [Paenibacillus radicibacter]